MVNYFFKATVKFITCSVPIGNLTVLSQLGQTERELNPYWKDGGSGLPSENPVTADSLQQATVTVGDQGVAWLRRALQRATEQAADQRRPLREVVAERWGVSPNHIIHSLHDPPHSHYKVLFRNLILTVLP